jgi:hypothetical protein
MIFKQLLSALPCLLIAGLAPSLPGCADPPRDQTEPASDVDQEGRPFSTNPSEPNHEEITAAALPFLRPEILLALQAANVSTDVEFAFESANHFDDCNFSGGSEVIAANEATAVANLDPADPSPERDALAIIAFGRALHAAQDFYAHSNWVELGATTIVDMSLGVWPTLRGYTQLEPSGIVVVEGNPPPGVKLSRRADEAYPQNALVFVKTKPDKKAPGLISGTVDYEPGNSCPDRAQLTHEELNKDHSDEPGREAQHVQAKALATAQSHHEWCRLIALAQAAWGEPGSQRLLAWTSDPAAAQCR